MNNNNNITKEEVGNCFNLPTSRPDYQREAILGQSILKHKDNLLAANNSENDEESLKECFKVIRDGIFQYAKSCILGEYNAVLCTNDDKLKLRNAIYYMLGHVWLPFEGLRADAFYEVNNLAYLLAQLARKINSQKLQDVLALQVSLKKLQLSTIDDAKVLEDKIEDCTDRFADCWDAVISEYDLLDDSEKMNIKLRELEKPQPIIKEQFIKLSKSVEESTEISKKIGIEYCRESLPKTFAEDVNRLNDIFKRAKDVLENVDELEKVKGEIIINQDTLKRIYEAKTSYYYYNLVSEKDENPKRLKNIKFGIVEEAAARDVLIKNIESFLKEINRVAVEIGSKTAEIFYRLRLDITTYSNILEKDNNIIQVLSSNNDILRRNIIIEELDSKLCEALTNFVIDLAIFQKKPPEKVTADETFFKRVDEIVTMAKNKMNKERDFFSTKFLKRLFGVKSENTIRNWKKHKNKAPPGFHDALINFDVVKMQQIAEIYKAKRKKKKGDALNSKHVVRGASAEQIHNLMIKK
ncbi:MAG: hypothetical protein IJQ34_08215 [Kiritimatiellae bacterium]|nr:hypothetical protein [Kiritimatiellia bacterium]